MSDTFKLILGMVFTIAMSAGAAQCSANIRAERLEERENNHYQEVLSAIRAMEASNQSNAQSIKTDMQAIRGEIMGILRDRR